MPRYEFVEGSSSKFWEIEKAKDGASYTVKWGRIGTAGQSKTKKEKNSGVCTRVVDDLIKEKLKKGYSLAADPNAKGKAKKGATPAPAAKSNPELEAAIHEAIDDKDRWLVYADWLQQNGDVRGELIALSAGKKTAAAKKFAEKNVDALWGDAKHLRKSDALQSFTWEPGWNKAKPLTLEVELHCTIGKFGLLEKIVLEGLDEEGHCATAMRQVLAAPIGRFVKSIEISLDERYSGSSGQPNFGSVMLAIASTKPRALRSLSMSAGGYQLSWTDTGDLMPLLDTTPYLEEIDIRMGNVEIRKPVDLPRLRKLRIATGGLDRANVRAISRSKWPALEELVLYLGRSEYGGNATKADVVALLAAKFPKLRTLGLCNAEIQKDVVKEIVKSPLLKQLESLDLSMGTLIDEEVQPIVQHAAAFQKLKAIDLSCNYLTDAMESQLKKTFKKAAQVGGSRYEEMMSDREQYGNEDWAKKEKHSFRYTDLGE